MGMKVVVEAAAAERSATGLAEPEVARLRWAVGSLLASGAEEAAAAAAAAAAAGAAAGGGGGGWPASASAAMAA
jgi:hypothetical protein